MKPLPTSVKEPPSSGMPGDYPGDTKDEARPASINLFAITSPVMHRRHRAIKAGNAMPMRIEFGVSELGCNAFLKIFGDEMLQSFRFVVKLVNGIVQDLKQKGLD